MCGGERNGAAFLLAAIIAPAIYNSSSAYAPSAASSASVSAKEGKKRNLESRPEHAQSHYDGVFMNSPFP